MLSTNAQDPATWRDFPVGDLPEFQYYDPLLWDSINSMADGGGVNNVNQP